MQNNTESSVNQAAEQEPATGSAGTGAPPEAPSGGTSAASKPPASAPAKKKTSKKKASKKKASKKKASKKKASKKKASKKKASKKKRGKKKAMRAAAAGSPWERLAEAAEEMRRAALELAEREAAEGRKALDDFVGATREKLTDLESMAERGIARLTGK